MIIIMENLTLFIPRGGFLPLSNLNVNNFLNIEVKATTLGDLS